MEMEMEKEDDNQAKAGMTVAEAAKELYRMLEKLLMAAKTANEINPVKIHHGLIRDVEDTLKEVKVEEARTASPGKGGSMPTDCRPPRDAVDELWGLVKKTEADVARKYAEAPEKEHARLKAKGETRTDRMSVQWEVDAGQMTASLSIEGVDGAMVVRTGWVEQAYPILWYRGCEKLAGKQEGGAA